MKKEVIKQAVKGLVLPVLGLSGAVVLAYRNFKLRNQNKVLIAKSEFQDALLGASNTMMKMDMEILEQLVKENESLKNPEPKKNKA